MLPSVIQQRFTTLSNIIGLTTAPRKKPTLHFALDTLARCGFDNICVFAEPDSPLPINKDIKVKQRKRTLGAWENWFWGLKELYDTYEQPYYCMVQDDIWAAHCIDVPGLLEGLDMNVGLYSLYTPVKYLGASEWNDIQQGSKLHMAQFYVIPRESARSIINSEEVWRIPGNYAIDNRIGLWAKYQRKRVLYRTPSLFDHIGETSTIWLQ